jgi:predicted nuclease of predicted toxin-antitoxin system
MQLSEEPLPRDVRLFLREAARRIDELDKGPPISGFVPCDYAVAYAGLKFVADESLAGPIVDRLRGDGWSVLSVRDGHLGADDPTVLSLAVREQAILLTEDKDFGELVFREKHGHCGVILIRIDGLRRDRRAEVVSELIRLHANEITGAFSVIDPSGIRIRSGQ